MRGLDSEIVLTSDELSEMSDEEVKRILPNLAVLSRALPQDKTRLVRLSQELDLVVGMTGDGINDAPSLKIADVGFAMASGADIAKAAGDIVLLDNSFLSINRTILYGRTIFKSIRKFITFQLIMNLTACGVSLVGQFLGIDNPITIIQMLWVNIIMDTLGGLAFAGEAPREHYMRERPKRRSEPILSRSMMSQILLTGLYTLSICVAFLIMPGTHTHFRDGAGDIYFMTGFYALFIFCGIFNCFGARSERMWMLSGIEKNKPFVLIMVFISAVQILMIYFGGSIFRTAPLLVRELGYVIGVSASVVPFEFVRRLFYKLRKRR
jgi:magnesium-transporting ATPase (P-type)